MQSETGFPSSHELKSYIASNSRLKLAARAVLSADAGLLVQIYQATVFSGMASGQKWISPLTGVSKEMYTTSTSVIPEIIMLKIIIAFKYLNYMFVSVELEHIAKPLNFGIKY